jgi:hypothetical protein
MPPHLVEEQRGGDRDVERLNASTERNPHDAIAALAHQTMQASPLAPHDEGDGGNKGAFVVLLGSRRISADDPHALALEAFQSGDHVAHAGHGEIRGRSGGRAGDGRTQSRGAPARNDDAMGPCGLGGSDDRTQIVWIFHAIEDEEEGRFPPLPGAPEEIVQVDERLHGSQRRDPLMEDAPGESVQPPWVHDLHGNLPRVRVAQYLLQGTSTMRRPRHENAGDRLPRSKRLQDRAPAEEGCRAGRSGVVGREITRRKIANGGVAGRGVASGILVG